MSREPELFLLVIHVQPHVPPLNARLPASRGRRLATAFLGPRQSGETASSPAGPLTSSKPAMGAGLPERQALRPVQWRHRSGPAIFATFPWVQARRRSRVCSRLECWETGPLGHLTVH